MAHSHAEVPSLQCPQCGASFSAEIWLIVDAAERPDLLERVLDGSIHEVVCPNGHVSGLDAPLLLFRPGESPPLIFSPAQGTTAEQDREMAGGLVAGLHNALGNDWRDEWLEGLAPVPRGLLPAFLSGDEEKLREAMAAAAAEAVPPAVAEVLAALAAEGVRIGSPEDLERALAERPELAARMRAALGGQQTSGPDISPIFREAIRQAGEAEARYRATGDRAALDTAAAAWERVLNHPEFQVAGEGFQLACLNNAGGVYLRRYWAGGLLADLDRALALWQAAVGRTPADSPDRASRLNNLGTGLRARYARSGRVADLDAAIAAWQDAVGRTPTDSPDRAGYQNNLGLGLSDRYARSGRVADLDAAIAAWQDAVDRTPTDSPDRASRLNNLGAGLRDRYARSGRVADLDAAIAAWQDAVGRTPTDSPDRAAIQNNLGNGLRARYARSGRVADLDAAIAAWQDAVGRTPTDSPDRAAIQNNLGNGLRARYARSGRVADLDAAIAAYEDAVGRTPTDSPDRASRLNNLGNGLRARYARSGRVADLDAAIAAWQDAVGRTPTDSPDRAAIQNNLGNGLRARYARSGRVADLDAAIAAWQDAVGRTPTDSPDRAGYQNNLGLGLRDRYARSGRVADLDAAIAAYEDAVGRTPTDSPDRASRLNNLGTGLRARYARSGRVADLDAAIAAYEDAVGRTPTDSPDRASRLNNLGNGLRARYARSGRVADLDAAIAAYEDAVDRTPAGSPDRAMYLNNLGNGLRDRYARSGRVADLDAAIAAYEDAVGRTPTDSPDRASRLNNLGAGLSDRYARSGRVADLAAAAGHYREATLAAAGTAGETALRAARAWASAALRKREWGEALEAVEHGRDTLRRLVEINTLTAEQQSWQREVQGLAAAAAYAHAGLGDAAAAALALEAGQATRLNAALGRGRDRDLLERLREEDGGLRSAYDNAAAERRAAEQTSARDPAGGPAEDPAAHSQRVAAAQAALDEVIARIKARPGYEELFAPAGYADVAAAVTPEQPPAYLATTAAGSVIVLLHAREGGVTAEAIFADLTTDELDRLLVRRAIMPGNVGEVEGGLLPAQVLGVNLSAELAEALPQVGARLMAPLAARLRALGAPRVALIPGGQLNLLPLHAATYEAGKATLAFLDEFIVAYAPSAQTLVESRARVVPGDETKLLAVGNPMPVRRPLRWARAEAESVADLFPGDHPPLLEEAATLEAVRAALVVKPGRDVLHFACHGSFDPGDPLRSALYLAHEEPLTMAEIRDMPLAGTRLAVLSACQTGLTDFRDIPDEVVGLPAGFLQAGVAGVVSSLWPVDDAGTMLLMERFHRFRREEGLDPAAALRSAQRWLRDRTRSELSDYYGDYMRMSSETAESGHIELPGGADTARVYADPYRWAAFTMTGA